MLMKVHIGDQNGFRILCSSTRKTRVGVDPKCFAFYNQTVFTQMQLPMWFAGHLTLCKPPNILQVIVILLNLPLLHG